MCLRCMNNHDFIYFPACLSLPAEGDSRQGDGAIGRQMCTRCGSDGGSGIKARSASLTKSLKERVAEEESTLVLLVDAMTSTGTKLEPDEIRTRCTSLADLVKRYVVYDVMC